MACHVAEGAFAERFHRIEDLEDHFQALSSAKEHSQDRRFSGELR